MYICLCQGVTDREIHAAIGEGARSMRDLRQRLGVCARCGKCGPCARDILSSVADSENSVAMPAPVAVVQVAGA